MTQNCEFWHQLPEQIFWPSRWKQHSDAVCRQLCIARSVSEISWLFSYSLAWNYSIETFPIEFLIFSWVLQHLGIIQMAMRYSLVFVSQISCIIEKWSNSENCVHLKLLLSVFLCVCGPKQTSETILATQPYLLVGILTSRSKSG